MANKVQAWAYIECSAKKREGVRAIFDNTKLAAALQIECCRKSCTILYTDTIIIVPISLKIFGRFMSLQYFFSRTYYFLCILKSKSKLG